MPNASDARWLAKIAYGLEPTLVPAGMPTVEGESSVVKIRVLGEAMARVPVATTAFAIESGSCRSPWPASARIVTRSIA
jgi:hypothetical protein